MHNVLDLSSLELRRAADGNKQLAMDVLGAICETAKCRFVRAYGSSSRPSFVLSGEIKYSPLVVHTRNNLLRLKRAF